MTMKLQRGDTIALLKEWKVAIERQQRLDMDVIAQREVNYCGTAACAIGTAGMHPPFIDLGLSLQWADYPDEYGQLRASMILAS